MAHIDPNVKWRNKGNKVKLNNKEKMKIKKKWEGSKQKEFSGISGRIRKKKKGGEEKEENGGESEKKKKKKRFSASLEDLQRSDRWFLLE